MSRISSLTSALQVMRLLHVQQAVPQAVVSSWVVHAFAKEGARSHEVLTSLRLWYQTAMPGGLQAWLLNGTFRYYLQPAPVEAGVAQVEPADGAVGRRPALDHVRLPGARPQGEGRGLPRPVRRGEVRGLVGLG